jgi:hypothetical protein
MSDDSRKGGIHAYNGKYNDRSKRQRSKILKGIKRVASARTFEMIRWEKVCKWYRPQFNQKSSHICDNCGNYKCFRK